MMISIPSSSTCRVYAHEASVELARAALLYTGAEDPKIELALEHFRSDYYGRINR